MHDFAATITGVSGFVGSHLARAFLEGPFRVRVFGADVAMTGRISDLMEHPDFTFERWDLNQPLRSDYLAVDTIYHFAGIADPSVYVTDPLRVMDLNLTALRGILERIVLWSEHRPRIVFSSTSEVYGKNTAVPFHEEETDLVFGPTQKQRWCYAMTKAVCEHYLHAYADKGIRHTVFRFFNFVGPDIDSVGSGRVITRMVGDALEEGVIRVVGSGEQTRCFTWIDDAVEALVLPTYMKKDVFRELPSGAITANEHYRDDFRGEDHTVNLGSDEEVSMLELAGMILGTLSQMGILGVTINVVDQEEFFGEGYEDVSRRVPDITRAVETLGWTATSRLDQFLPEIVEAVVRDWEVTNHMSAADPGRVQKVADMNKAFSSQEFEKQGQEGAA
jgi:UDP-glucose 4-epimerase